MKKILLLTLLLTNSLIVLGQTGWKTLDDKEYTIKYPDNWTTNTSGTMGTKFYLYAELTGQDDKFGENINLMIKDFTGLNIDLEKFVSISENQIMNMFNNGKILKSERVVTNGLEHHKIIFQANKEFMI